MPILYRLRDVRTWAAIGAIAVAAFAFKVDPYAKAQTVAPKPSAKEAISQPLGAPFELTAHDGKPFSSDRLRDRPFAVFFGFTNCPEVCPTTLNDLTGIMEDLGPDADKITFMFVSVDPERDTPELLRTYLSYFDKRIIGLSGNPVDIASLVGKFGAFYERIASRSDYTMNHSTWMYLVGRDGKMANQIAYREERESQIAKLRALARK